MMTRAERRRALKSLGRRVTGDPCFKRMTRNIREHGKVATEIYRLDGIDGDSHIYFDIFSLRLWLREHGVERHMLMDWDRALRLLDSGAIDPEWLKAHTVRTGFSPIVVARNATSTGDQIIDGAHRYAALALSAVANGLKGAPLPVPAYALEPEEWRPFVVPAHVAAALDFDRHTGAPSIR